MDQLLGSRPGGQLLFLGGRFTEEASDLDFGFPSIKKLSKQYGNTITSTLWRYVEQAHHDLPMVGVISDHLHRPSAEFDPQNPCRYCIQSPAFRDRFSRLSEKQLFRAIRGYCTLRSRGPIGSDSVILKDDNDERHLFQFESFSNGYDVLTVGRYERAFRVSVAV